LKHLGALRGFSNVVMNTST